MNAGQEEAQGDFLASGVGWSSPAKALCRCCAVGGPWPAASPCAGKKAATRAPRPRFWLALVLPTAAALSLEHEPAKKNKAALRTAAAQAGGFPDHYLDAERLGCLAGVRNAARQASGRRLRAGGVLVGAVACFVSYFQGRPRSRGLAPAKFLGARTPGDPEKGNPLATPASDEAGRPRLQKPGGGKKMTLCACSNGLGAFPICPCEVKAVEPAERGVEAAFIILVV